MRRFAIALLLAVSFPSLAAAKDVKVEEVSLTDLQAMMTAGKTSSVDIVKAYLARIAAMDRKGPALRAVIAINPDALAQAKALDAERKAGRVRGPLHGVPILIKDNIETADAMPTTAGSLALKDNFTRRDAPVIAALRAQGAVILGKTNLSEWANIRSTHSMSGWSGVGGLVKNPYALDRTACGSSSGSGAAVAASFAAAALGTETDGSVVCPSSLNGLVGLKPSIGMVSRTHVVPISHSQDTPGPMGRSVRDVATLLSAMVAPDPADAVTMGAVTKDYAAGLSTSALSGMRVGVIRPKAMSKALVARFEAALGVLKDARAVLVEVTPPKLDGLGDAEFMVLKTELKADLNAYLATTPASVTTRTLDDVIAFDTAHAATEMPFFAQEIFDDAATTKGLDDPAYRAARAKSLRLAGVEGIDAMLKTANAAILVEPSYGAAWLSDPVYGDQYDGPSSSELPAIAGYPNLTVPMGLVGGLPVGLSFITGKNGEATVLGAGYAYEQRSHARVAPRYLPSADVGAGLEGAGLEGAR
ncbi:amidase [Sphingomonas oligophenolica]|uniref:Amidase n=1 Tax=Sphingomonas oligophenolica TaxID=301154 RepID=A0A502CJ85_9SPHN|nr:amidase [Sphingomonas oligophenolica]TPG12139.1 amidase [Sphingomonas oligophenolica]